MNKKCVEKKVIRLCHISKNKDNENRIYEGLKIPKDKYVVIIDEQDPDYIFANEWIYYNKECYDKFISLQDKKRINIFYAGECIYPDLNIFDYVISYIKFPQVRDRVGYIHPIDFQINFVNKDKLFKKLNNNFDRSIFDEKTKFCNFIYTNGNAHPYRDFLFREISKYKKVDSLGVHLRNVDIKEQFVDAELRENYKFTIAAENAVFDGYFTEKIYGAYQANTIPIYWGEPHIEEYCNPKSFINANKLSIKELIYKIQYLDNNDDAYLEVLSEPFMTDEQYQNYLQCKQQYKTFIENLFDQPLEKAKRIPEGYHPNIYRLFFSGLDFNGVFDSQKMKETKNCFTDNVFSVKNEYKNNTKRKVITILGVKIKIKIKNNMFIKQVNKFRKQNNNSLVNDFYSRFKTIPFDFLSEHCSDINDLLYEKLITEDRFTFIRWVMKRYCGQETATKKEIQLINNKFDEAKKIYQNRHYIEEPMEFDLDNKKIKYITNTPIINDSESMAERLMNYYAPVHAFMFKEYQLDGFDPQNGQAIFDCGGANGDTVILFKTLYPNSKVFSFEGFNKNCEFIYKNIEMNNFQDVIVENGFLYSKTGDAYLNPKTCEIMDTCVNKDYTKIKTISIDDYCNENDITNIGLIKFDIEGGEQEALKGAINTIKSQKPILMIPIYHRIDDCYAIPKFLKDLNMDYECRLKWTEKLVIGVDCVLFVKFK